MNKILYVTDNNENTKYNYNIIEDTIIHHFSINSSSTVDIVLETPGVSVYYYYHNVNYDDNTLKIKVQHKCSNTHSELHNNGVNVGSSRLTYYVDGIVLPNSYKCICNQENQIVNLENGKSTICPNLLIDNYDVDSNHGAHIGKFKESKIFYLMSRGISRKEATKLLLRAFLLRGDNIDLSQINLFVNELEKI